MKTPIPMIDLHAQYQDIKPEIDAVISKSFEEMRFIGGAPVTRFEEDFADFLGTGEVVSCANGTDSMELILNALNIGPGDEVIVPAHTWISTSEVVVTAGATPVFADVTYNTCCIAVDDVKAKLTPRTKAVIAVHLYGHPADLEALRNLCDTNGLHLIEDCAQSHGTQYKNKNAGTWGVASSFSFYPGKNLGCYGDGGAVYTEDEILARRIRQLSNHGQLQKHDHQIHGRNSRLDTLQARVLSAKLPYLKKWIEQKNKHAQYYSENLKTIDAVDIPIVKKPAYHSWHLYVIKLKERDALMEFLEKEGVQTGIHYPKALPFQPCYAGFGHQKADFPVAARLQDEILSLPMYAELQQEQLDHVIGSIHKFFS